VVQLENTPKALANVSPGFELARTLGPANKSLPTLKGLCGWRTLTGFHRSCKY